MAVSTVRILAPADGIGAFPNTIKRPAVTFDWTGGVGSWDWEVIWDDDATFANGNGNRQIKTGNAASIVDTTVAPDSDLGDLSDGTQWYIRVTVWDTADYQNEIWSIDHDHTGGTFDLAYNASTALNIPWNETNANLKTAIEGLTGLTTVTVTGSTGNWTVEVTDPGNENLNQITIDGTNLTGGTTATATTDSEGNDGGPQSDSHTFTYSNVNPNTRVHLYHLQNIGVGFHDKDEPTAGWGTGIGGTEGPDGNNWEDFGRYVYHLQNVGVGFSKDEPGGGWGPNSPSTDAPDGFNIDFDRYLYHLQNIDSTQPCPYLFSASQAQVQTGDSIKVFGQGLVSATNPTADAWDAELRLYEAPSFAAAYTALSITDWTAGATQDTITATIPGGVSSGFLAVVHTTTPTCSGSNFLGLTVIAKPADRESGWWVEVWNLRNTTKILTPVPQVAEADFESIANDIGAGQIILRGDDDDIDEIVDRTTSPEVQNLVKVYLHDRFAYSFIPQDAEEDYDEDGARSVRIFGRGQESILTWGKALWKDYPAQPTITRTWIYGSQGNQIPWGNMDGENQIDNGGGEDADVDPAAKVGTAGLFADTAEARTGNYSIRVTPAALDDGVEWEYGVRDGRETFADLYLKTNDSGLSPTYTAELLAEDDTVVDSQVLNPASSAWIAVNLDDVPEGDETYRIRVTQTAGTLAAFFIDDVAGYSTINGTIDESRAVYMLNRTYTAGGLHSMKLVMDAGGDSSFNGIVIYFPVTPNEEYTITVPISGPAADVVRVAARIGGTVNAVEQALTGLGTFDSIVVTGTAGPEETTARFAISSKESAALTVYVDEVTIRPGAPKASAGQIIKDVHDSMVARGVLDFIQLGFDGSVDSSGFPWPEDLAFEVDPTWSLWDLCEKFIGFGYDVRFAPTNWIAGGDSGWNLDVYAPLGAGIDHSVTEDGPAILPGDTIREVEPSRTPPAETVVWGEGFGGLWSMAETTASRIAALERREAFVNSSKSKDNTTLFRVLTHRLNTALKKGAQFTAGLTDDADPLPYYDFTVYDRLRAHLPGDDNGRDLVPDDLYRTAAIAFRGTADGTNMEFDVDFGSYKLHAQRLRDMLLQRQIQRETAENFQPGTGSISSPGDGGSSSSGQGSSDSVELAVVPPHPHVWTDIQPSVNGDLAGSFPAPTVKGLRGIPLPTGTPADADGIAYDLATNKWVYGAVGGGGGSVNTLTVERTSDQSIATAGAVVSWQQEDADSDAPSGAWAIGNPTRLVAWASGWYYVTANLEWETTATADRYIYLIRSSDSKAHGHKRFDVAATNYQPAVGTSAPIYLAANEYVEVFAGHDDGTNRNLKAGAHTRATMTLIGSGAASTAGAWQTPTLGASWVVYSASYDTAQYRKDSMGVVHLRGLIKDGTTTNGTVLFTLPVGFRPANDHIFPTNTNSDAHTGISVRGVNTVAGNPGEVQIRTGVSNTWLTLAGIYFHADG